MMRALWTAASGMTSQQTNVDVIANNLANVNTTAYKTETAQFKSLLYQTIQSKTTSANGETKPVGAQVGLGVRNSAITSIFRQGTLTQTDKTTDFAISGEGFFTVKDSNGELRYTRDGSFNWALSPYGGVMLCTQQGYPVLDIDGNEIVIPEEYTVSKLSIDGAGNICYPDEETGNPVPLGMTVGVVQFQNAAGLSKESGTMYAETDASGMPVSEYYTEDIKRSTLVQGYLEASNVNVADEMVNLIVAQRAYEMNSKAIQTADTMLGQANQLKS
ncbi:MAG: flagellar basal-body rod protein FlgG [Lachnospiraceae bacterium]|nr:flagellar basal-body rod protein FlgG [Lachnospiraceae bacterium]